MRRPRNGPGDFPVGGRCKVRASAAKQPLCVAPLGRTRWKGAFTLPYRRLRTHRFSDADLAGEGPATPAPPRGPSLALRPYWLATMHRLGPVSTLTLAVIDTGFRLGWEPASEPPPRRWLRNHPSARAHAELCHRKRRLSVTRPALWSAPLSRTCGVFCRSVWRPARQESST